MKYLALTGVVFAGMIGLALFTGGIICFIPYGIPEMNESGEKWIGVFPLLIGSMFMLIPLEYFKPSTKGINEGRN